MLVEYLMRWEQSPDQLHNMAAYTPAQWDEIGEQRKLLCFLSKGPLNLSVCVVSTLQPGMKL